MLKPDSLAELEMVVSRTTGAPEAVFDLSAAQADATQDALVYYRRVRFAGAEMDTAMVLELRALDGLSDQTESHGEAAAVVRVSFADARTLAEATALYVADRDVESYQSPEERARIALLSELSEPLRRVAFDLRDAEIRLARQPAGVS
ncbi:MAG: hypothetical protein ABSH51_03230 [Solirubrobacteraceae bacterium]